MLKVSKKALFAGVSGTALQWYDFTIFGYFAPFIAATYFPSENKFASLLSTLGVFAVGYLLAPLGSFLLGFVGDRLGRKKALTLSILAMTIPTAFISLVSSYQSIGILAPIIITLCRILQGLVASSEFIGSAIFLVEHAKQNQKAFYGSLTSTAYSAGLILAEKEWAGCPDWRRCFWYQCFFLNIQRWHLKKAQSLINKPERFSSLSVLHKVCY
jgi:MFS transporter, MHS family, proline/betaine transporter